MLRMHTNGVRRHADETPRLGRRQKRRHAQRRNARHIRDWLRPWGRFFSFCGRFDWPRFERNYALRCAHIALRDATTLSVAMARQINCQTDFLEFPHPHSCSAER